MKKFYYIGFFIFVSILFSSCIILDFDECRYDAPKLIVKNESQKKGYNACYISNVYYKTSKYDNWSELWSNDNFYDDYCKTFYLDEDCYYFCVRIVYPNMSNRYDYYDDFMTNSKEYLECGDKAVLVFDGDEINFYKK